MPVIFKRWHWDSVYISSSVYGQTTWPCQYLGQTMEAATEVLHEDTDLCSWSSHNMWYKYIYSRDAYVASLAQSAQLLHPAVGLPQDLFPHILLPSTHPWSVPPDPHARAPSVDVLMPFAPTKLPATKHEFNHLHRLGITCPSWSKWALPLHMIP